MEMPANHLASFYLTTPNSRCFAFSIEGRVLFGKDHPTERPARSGVLLRADRLFSEITRKVDQTLERVWIVDRCVCVFDLLGPRNTLSGCRNCGPTLRQSPSRSTSGSTAASCSRAPCCVHASILRRRGAMLSGPFLR